MKKLSNQYVAGFFDGEGCVRIGRTTKKRNGKTRVYYDLNARISQVNSEVLYLIQNQFDGTVGAERKPDGRVIPYWTVCGPDAAYFLSKIFPYLIVKRKEAEIALDFQDHVESLKGKLQFSRKSKEGDEAYLKAAKKRESMYQKIIKAKDKNRQPLQLAQ